jgi:hypothetical protein
MISRIKRDGIKILLALSIPFTTPLLIMKAPIPRAAKRKRTGSQEEVKEFQNSNESFLIKSWKHVARKYFRHQPVTTA